jgi:hypothetical protein
VLVPGLVSHVERVWEEPRARAVLMDLAQLGRLILFDRRGVGLSDRVGAAPTVEATADDIVTVMDAAGSRRVLLIGASYFRAELRRRPAGGDLVGLLRAASSPGTIKPSSQPCAIPTCAPCCRGLGRPPSSWTAAAIAPCASRPAAIWATLSPDRGVAPDGKDHWLWAGEQSAALEKIRNFLGQLPTAVRSSPRQ